MQMMSLGMFVFHVPTLAFDELQRRTDWRHARSARIGARDATQFVGVGDETIALNGSAMAELQEGRASIEELRDMADTGEAWALVDGNGRALGAFVITGIDERQRAFFPDGTARQIDFGIDLLRVDSENAAALVAGELPAFLGLF
jgi:phage protein U